MYRLEEIRSIEAGTDAVTVKVNGLGCLVQNNSDSASVYLKEMREDGEEVTADNGWRLPAGGELRFPMTVRELSICASADETDVRILILDEE